MIKKKKLRDDAAAIRENHPCVKIIEDYAKLLTVSIHSMSENYYDLFEKYSEKQQCSQEEFQYVERLWIDAVKALEHTSGAAGYINELFKQEDRKEDIPVSAEICEECVNEINRLLASGYEKKIAGDAGGRDLKKLLAKAAEIYAASINKAVRTLIGRVSSIEEAEREEHDLSKEAFRKMDDLCKCQADTAYSAAEISAYFGNIARSLKK